MRRLAVPSFGVVSIVQVPGTPSYGQGGWGTHSGYIRRYDSDVPGELKHLAITGALGLIIRNPYVSLGLGLVHGIFHLGTLSITKQDGSVWVDGVMIELPFDQRPGGGGPGQSPISTIPPLSLEATGASLTQLGKPGVPASSSKRGSRPRRKCKPGYRWNGHRCVRKD